MLQSAAKQVVRKAKARKGRDSSARSEQSSWCVRA